MVPLMPELPDDAELDPELAALLPEKLCRESLLVPVSRQDETLEVAFVSPDDMLVLDELQLLTGMTIRPLIGPLEEVSRLIEALYSARQVRPEFCRRRRICQVHGRGAAATRTTTVPTTRSWRSTGRLRPARTGGSSAWSTRCSSRRCGSGPATSTSNLSRTVAPSGCGWTACCAS